MYSVAGVGAPAPTADYNKLHPPAQAACVGGFFFPLLLENLKR